MEDILVTQIKDRYKRVIDSILSTKKSNSSQDIKVVVVSKSKPVDVIQAAVEVGITRFGENYLEEATHKINNVGRKAIEWHMIGHIQSRKVAAVIEHFDWIHSVDSLKLANRLNSCSEIQGRKTPILLEVNISGESSKNGFLAWEEKNWSYLIELFSTISALPFLDVRGLMTMPPLTTNPFDSRSYFKKMHCLQDYLMKNVPITSWHELSMGTSIDYLVAVEEGATYLRIGEAILGSRSG